MESDNVRRPAESNIQHVQNGTTQRYPLGPLGDYRVADPNCSLAEQFCSEFSQANDDDHTQPLPREQMRIDVFKILMPLRKVLVGRFRGNKRDQLLEAVLAIALFIVLPDKPKTISAGRTDKTQKTLKSMRRKLRAFRSKSKKFDWYSESYRNLLQEALDSIQGAEDVLANIGIGGSYQSTQALKAYHAIIDVLGEKRGRDLIKEVFLLMESSKHLNYQAGLKSFVDMMEKRLEYRRRKSKKARLS